MAEELKTVMHIVNVALAITAICATAFPVLYLFSPWYRSHLGRAVMIQSMSLAFAVDISFVFRVWRFTDDLYTLLIINLVLLALISIGSVYLAGALVYYNFIKKEDLYGPDKVSVPE